MVFHCEDHEPYHACVFCPVLYKEVSIKTWTDPSVFIKLHVLPSDFKFHQQSLVPKELLSLYSWGIDPTADIPSGTLLLKRKKQFRIARTIVDYSKCALSKLLKAVSIILQEVLFTTWPQTIGHLSIPQIWKSVHF